MMEGTVVIVIGAIGVILALAGLALLAVWLQNRISGKSLPPGVCRGANAGRVQDLQVHAGIRRGYLLLGSIPANGQSRR